MLFHTVLTLDPEGCSVVSLRLDPAHSQHGPGTSFAPEGHGSARRSPCLEAPFHVRSVV